MRWLLITCLDLYKRLLSPLLPPACRFVPTCSEYAREALMTHGVIKGGWLSLLRILRCNPLFAGGLDPVPPRKNAQHAAKENLTSHGL